MEILPRHVICILNNDQNVIRKLCNDFPGFDYDEEYSQGSAHDEMVHAFEASMDKLIPTFSDQDRVSISKHTTVNYVLSPSMKKGSEVEISSKALALVAEAFNRGALAVKGESSSIAHGKQRWIELFEKSKINEEKLLALYRAWVRLPISDQNKLYSVGMHLIGMKDVEIQQSNLAIDDLDLFLLYLVVDKAEPNIRDGQTFSRDSDSERYIISSIECSRYETNDFFFNPNGLWSLELNA